MSGRGERIKRLRSAVGPDHSADFNPDAHVALVDAEIERVRRAREEAEWARQRFDFGGLLRDLVPKRPKR